MEHPMFAQECCPNLHPLPLHIDCLSEDIRHVYEHLRKRYKEKFESPNYHIVELAQPVPRRSIQNGTKKKKCPCRIGRRIQMTYLEDDPYPPRTRTEQLAYPVAWRLALTKDHVKKYFPPKRIDVLNRTLRKSYLSVYSKLANAVLPPYLHPNAVPRRKKVRTKMPPEKAEEYLKKMAKAKKYKDPPPIERESKPLKAMDRFETLAIPKFKYEFLKPEWVFTKAMKDFKSEYINKLAVAKTFPNFEEPLELPIRPTAEAMKYKASARIKELGEPKLLRKAETDLKENPFSVAPNALKYRISNRMKELAEPKEREDKHIRLQPNLISPTALTYTASKRIISLAEPRQR